MLTLVFGLQVLWYKEMFCLSERFAPQGEHSTTTGLKTNGGEEVLYINLNILKKKFVFYIYFLISSAIAVLCVMPHFILPYYWLSCCILQLCLLWDYIYIFPWLTHSKFYAVKTTSWDNCKPISEIAPNTKIVFPFLLFIANYFYRGLPCSSFLHWLCPIRGRVQELGLSKFSRAFVMTIKM